MKKFPRIEVMNAQKALEYVYFYSGDPKYPKYAIISIQNPTRGYGLGLEFKKGGNCLAALNIEFSDATPVFQIRESVLMTTQNAWEIHDFVESIPNEVELIIIHCTKGESRSVAVAAALLLVKTGEKNKFHVINQYVYYNILETYGMPNLYWEKYYDEEKKKREHDLNFPDELSEKLEKIMELF